ncbi:MAG: hypothetical protein ACXABY_09460 [Candidatus Thorarchaeota archaeon]|jgi:hypothetical protein
MAEKPATPAKEPTSIKSMLGKLFGGEALKGAAKPAPAKPAPKKTPANYKDTPAYKRRMEAEESFKKAPKRAPAKSGPSK